MNICQSKNFLEILTHHIKTYAGGNIDEILKDYDEDIIAFSYEDNGIQLAKGLKEQKKQLELVCTKDGAPPNLENGIYKINCMQSIGDYAILSLHASPFIVFGARTFIARNGKILYTTSYDHQPSRFEKGEKPIRLGNLSASGQHTRKVIDAYLKALSEDDFRAAKALRSEKTLLITDLDNQVFVGGEAVNSFWEKERNYLRSSAPTYIVDEAEGPLAFLVYKNEQGITAETYLIEDSKIVFESIIHTDGIF